MLSEWKGTGVVEEIDGKKVVRMQIPIYFEGHSFVIEMFQEGESAEESHCYRFEFVLGDSFSNEFRAISADNFVGGFSCLALNKELKSMTHATCHYALKTDKNAAGKAILTFKTNADDGVLQRVVIEVKEPTLEEAFKYAESIINDLLDSFTYTKSVPLEIRRIEIYDNVSNKNIRNYIQLPYKTIRDLTKEDMDFSSHVHERIRPFLRLLREATNSNNTFYRLLCLYRIFESIKVIKTNNNSEARAKGVSLTRDKVRIPENNFTKEAFPQFINVPVEVFIDHVREDLRLNIAHLNLNDFFGVVLDPAYVGHIHKVDQVNALLLLLARLVIKSEIDFMIRSGISA